MSDELDHLVHALREETLDTSDGQLTRARLSRTLSREESRPRWHAMAAAAALALAIGSSSALAATGGFARAWSFVEGLFAAETPRTQEEEVIEPVRRSPPIEERSAGDAPPAPIAAVEAPAPIVAEPAPPRVVIEGMRPTRQPSPAIALEEQEPVVVPAAPVPEPAQEPRPIPQHASLAPTPEPEIDARQHLMFRSAIEAHRRGDAIAALRQWDAYLAAYPSGRYALESRFHRALDLVRLGRERAAYDALAPFAHGVHGGYRRDEARALRERLGVRLDLPSEESP